MIRSRIKTGAAVLFSVLLGSWMVYATLLAIQMLFQDNMSITQLLLFHLLILPFYFVIKSTLPEHIIIGDGLITVRKWPVGSKRTFSFEELDGYYDQIQRSWWGPFKIIYLTKGGKRKVRILEMFYSNFDQLLEGLNGLKYMGRRQYHPFKIDTVQFPAPTKENQEKEDKDPVS